jgi:hypothetical protein
MKGDGGFVERDLHAGESFKWETVVMEKLKSGNNRKWNILLFCDSSLNSLSEELSGLFQVILHKLSYTNFMQSKEEDTCVIQEPIGNFNWYNAVHKP